MIDIRFQGANGDRLTLRIVGYQFDGANGSEDDDWLLVEGHVVRDGVTWRFHDPCLTAAEALNLATWLRQSIAVRPSKPARLQFIEPNLIFERLAPPTLVVLRHGTIDPGCPSSCRR